MTKVAVVMVTFNGERYIEEQLVSILNQKLDEDIELDIYVRDNASTDNTVAILNEYEKENKIKLTCLKNDGPAVSFLSLIREIDGYDYYFLCDQDDCWNKEKVGISLARMKNDKVPTMFFSNAELVNEKMETMNGNVYKKEPPHDLMTIACSGGILGCTVAFNAELRNFILNVPIKKDQIIMHDYLLALVCAAIDGRIIYYDQPLVKYRQHGNNVVGVSTSVRSKLTARLKNVYKKNNVSISDQTSLVLNSLKNYISKSNVDKLSCIVNYKKNRLTRLLLALSTQTKYYSFTASLSVRLGILMGNV